MNPDKLLTGSKKSIVPWLGKTMKHIDILMNAVLQQSGLDLTKNQIKVLQLIHAGMKNQSDLSVITERNKSSLSRIIQSLQRKGFVRKTVDINDKRQLFVELTDKGREKLIEAVPILETNFSKMEHGIDESELEQLKVVLSKILKNVEKELEKLN